MIPLLAVLGEPFSNEARTLLFCFVTAGVVIASLLIVRRVRDYELVILGIVLALATIGYGLVGIPVADALPGGTAELTRTLMKIAVVLVLAGVVRSFLLAYPSDAAPTPKP